MERLILIGGGEHARVIADAIRSRAAAYELLGFVDPNPRASLAGDGVRYLGTDDVLVDHTEASVVLAFGALSGWRKRTSAVARLRSRVARWGTVVHSSAWLSPTATVGEGSVIMAGAVVQTGARIGEHCVINSGAIVEHDVVLGSNVHVAPGAVLGGGVRIGDDSYVGLGARVRDHVAVGDGATVAMGSVVVSAVSAGAIVRGVPAR